MRKLILQMQTSIDGFVADNSGGTDWMVWNWGPNWTWDEQLRQYHYDTIASADTLLLSSHLAEEGFIDHWANVAKQDGPQTGFAGKTTEAHKVIFSNPPTNIQSRWDNTVIATRELSEEVNALKNMPGKNLLSFGGAGFAAALIAADLVDEFHFIVNPTVLGKGLSIFKLLSIPQRLSLLEATSYGKSMVVLKYAKK